MWGKAKALQLVLERKNVIKIRIYNTKFMPCVVMIESRIKYFYFDRKKYSQSPVLLTWEPTCDTSK